MNFKPKIISLDCETTGLRWYAGKLYSLAFAWHGEDGRMKSAVYPASDVPSGARKLLADPTVAKVGHRIRFDLKWLISNGIDVKGATHCTKIMQHLLDENADNGLKALVLKHFGPAALSDEAAMKSLLKKLNLQHVGQLCALDLTNNYGNHWEIISNYNREDAINTLRLFPILRDKLKALDVTVKRVFGALAGPKDYYLVESLPSERVLLDTELTGIYLDEKELQAYGNEIEAKEALLLQELEALAKEEIEATCDMLWEKEKTKKKTDKGKAGTPRPRFNFNAGQHLGHVLYVLWKVQVRVTASGSYNTSEETLRSIREAVEPASKVARFLVGFAAWKRLQKERNTYVGDADSGLLSHRTSDGKVYAEYHPFIDTGRLGSTAPNMQNLPRGSRCKAAFKPSAGSVFIYADYSQVELRIAAHLSQDPTMVEAFQQNLDLHVKTAAALFDVDKVTPEQRQKGKTCNFLLIFDGGPRRLQEEMPEFSVERCKEFKDRFFEAYPVYKAYLASQLASARQRLALVSEAGRIRRIPDLAFGEGINWRRREYSGPEELRRRLELKLKKQGIEVTDATIFDAAGRAFSHGKKQAYNFPIQSLGASITKRALIALSRQGFKTATTVHDSIVVEVAEEDAYYKAKEVTAIMESAYPLSVPLKVDVKILRSLSESDLYVAKHLTLVKRA